MTVSIVYEVTTVFEDPQAGDMFHQWMIEDHIPTLLATGCFTGATLERISPTRYRGRFAAPSRAELDRYLADHAPAVRAEFTRRFPSGASASREIWEVIHELGRGA